MKGLPLLMPMVETKVPKKSKIYGFCPKNVKISGFSSFPVFAQPPPNDFYLSKESFFDKSTFEEIKKVGTPGQQCEIDEIRISPYTKCMGANFDRKFLSAKNDF